MIRWSLFALVLAAIFTVQEASALPHRGMSVHNHAARSAAAPTSSTMNVTSAVEKTVSKAFKSKPRNGVLHEGHKIEMRSNDTKKEIMAQRLQKSIQKQIDEQSLGGGLDINIQDILGEIDGDLKIQGSLSDKKNKTTVITSPKSESSQDSSSSSSSSSKPSSSSTSSKHSSTSLSKHHKTSSKHSTPSSSSSSSTPSTTTSSGRSSTSTSTTSDGASSTGLSNARQASTSSGSGSKSSQRGGFYRIGVNQAASTAQRIGDESTSSSVPGGRVAAKANEPNGNLPNQSVITNNPSYGFLEAQDDLYTIRKWAGDLGELASKKNRNETIMALFDAASRYYPDVDTKTVVRIMLADIKAESDFKSGNVSPGRVDSGNSVGLLQVSPYGSGELDQFKKMVQSAQNTYSWAVGTATSEQVKLGGFSELGPLMDFKNNDKMDVSKLSNSDLSRPWVNIHVAMWIQANLARTGSQDPSDWGKVSKSSQNVRQEYAPAIQELISSNSSGKWSQSQYSSALSSLEKDLKGKYHQKPCFATGLGSWVAGPAASDSSGYTRSGDDISAQYFENISKGLSVLYTGSEKNSDKYGKSWLENIELTAGLVDYSD